MELTAIPGGELVARGLRDLAAEVESTESLLVSIGATNLRELGFDVVQPPVNPEARLYALLARDNEEAAHGRYNALVRRLVSFERAARCATP